MPARQGLELNSPTEMSLVTDNNLIRDDYNRECSKVQMKKQLGLLEGVAIILGIIFGSG